MICVFIQKGDLFFHGEGAIGVLLGSRGLGDRYKRQLLMCVCVCGGGGPHCVPHIVYCLVYTADAAEDPPCGSLGGRGIIDK